MIYSIVFMFDLVSNDKTGGMYLMVLAGLVYKEVFLSTKYVIAAR